jgi:integrase
MWHITRTKKNRDLIGTNIKCVTKAGKDFFYYILPNGTLAPLVHGDRTSSIEAAIALNQALRPSGSAVERVIAQATITHLRPEERDPHFIEVLDLFEKEWLPAQGYARASLEQRQIKLNQYRRHFQHKTIGHLDTFAIAQFLRTFGAESARQHRVLLEQIFRFAASNGFSTQRPMLDIEKRKQEKRKRARHTWEGYQAIYNACPQWLKNACDAALYTLQRRADLVNIKVKEHIDIEARTIRILQAKSRNYDKPVFIEIAMGDALYKTIKRATASDIPCPYLVRHRQKTLSTPQRHKKPHPFAVLPEYLTRAYSEVRDRVGVYNHLPKIERPSFHSIRALGIWLYTKAGYPDDYIMALAGHATEAMKARYTEGHEKPAPVRVNADLDLTAVNLQSVNWQTDLSKKLRTLADTE